MQEVHALRREMTRTQDEFDELRDEFADASGQIRDIAGALLRLETTERLERDKLLLQLENTLLKFERRLPAPCNEDE